MARTATPTGLQCEETTTGEGAEARKGQNGTVHYAGWLYKDGQQGAVLKLAHHARLQTQVLKPRIQRGPQRRVVCGQQHRQVLQ